MQKRWLVALVVLAGCGGGSGPLGVGDEAMIVNDNGSTAILFTKTEGETDWLYPSLGTLVRIEGDAEDAPQKWSVVLLDGPDKGRIGEIKKVSLRRAGSKR